MNNTLDFADTLCKIKEDCVLEFGGALVHKYIHIMVNFSNKSCSNIKSCVNRDWQGIISTGTGLPL